MRQVSGRPVTVEIVDDHFLFAQALSGMVGEQDGFEVVGIAVTGSQALGIAKERQPDVVLLDYHLPGVTADVLLPRLKALAPATKVIVLTSDTSRAARLSAEAAGAEGFITKEAAIDEVIEGIRTVLQITVPEHERSVAVGRPDPPRRPAPAGGPRRRKTDLGDIGRRESDGAIVELPAADSFVQAAAFARRLEGHTAVETAWVRSFDGSRATIRVRTKGSGAELEAAVRGTAAGLRAEIHR